jgi:Na+/glutamate symporter
VRRYIRLERALLIALAALAVGLLFGLLVGFFLGRIGGNREEAAPPLPSARTVTVEEPVPAPEKTVSAPEKTVPATTATARPHPDHRAKYVGVLLHFLFTGVRGRRILRS